MSELDDFRPRIRNWARAYRNRFARSESNLMILIRNMRGNRPAQDEFILSVDIADADFVEACIAELRLSSPAFESLFPVLKAEYLTRFSGETFENVNDERRATKRRARYAKVFAWRYNSTLINAEEMLMRFVEAREQSNA